MMKKYNQDEFPIELINWSEDYAILVNKPSGSHEIQQPMAPYFTIKAQVGPRFIADNANKKYNSDKPKTPRQEILLATPPPQPKKSSLDVYEIEVSLQYTPPPMPVKKRKDDL
ncbi:MAG: hypothetical protein KJ906_01710 [Nanoarchaeota archaeon]|nr:hypothetical protein [Nanoarchaeota archaeon]